MKNYVELQTIMEQNPTLFEGLTPARKVKFKEWLPNNMHIYQEFVRCAQKLRLLQNRYYYSARMIWEKIRWDTIMKDRPEGYFKMSDLNMPFVSWLAMAAEPELKGMFKQKRGVRG